MYAVVRTGGKQYRVQEGRPVTIERLPGAAGDTVELGDVLLMADGADITIGAPLIEGARIVGTIAEQGRAKKIIVFRYKNKTRSRKKTGHRQQFTKLLVEDILAPGEKPMTKQAASTPVAAVDAEPPKARGRRKTTAAAPSTAKAQPAKSDAADEKPKRTRTRKKAE